MERDDLTMLMAQNIQAEMAAKNLSAAALARKANINATGVYDILSGKSRSPRLETVVKIAAALEVSVPYLLEDHEDRNLRAEIEGLLALLPKVERERLVLTARAWVSAQAS